MQQPPNRGSSNGIPNLLLLDAFSEKDLQVWERASQDIDELYRTLYFSVEPKRRQLMPQIIEALSERSISCDFMNWFRLVDTRWTLHPLSAAGSLTGCGGRFNIGRDVADSIPKPFPAIYIGQDYETAFREKFQLESGTTLNGLAPEDLSLNGSFSSYRMSGHLERVLDVSDLNNLIPLCAVLKRIRMPVELKALAKRLRLGPSGAYMIKTAPQMQDAIQQKNWRAWSVQFDLPSPSQQLAHWAISAGFEGIRYRSTKSSTGYCLAVFPSNIGSDRSIIQLDDPAAPEVQFTKLDLTSCTDLCGWDMLSSSLRPS